MCDVLEKTYDKDGLKKDIKGANKKNITNRYKKIYDILDIGYGINIKL